MESLTKFVTSDKTGIAASQGGVKSDTRHQGAGKQKNKIPKAVWALSVSFLFLGGGSAAWAQGSASPTSDDETYQTTQDIQDLTMQEAVQKAVTWYPSISEALGRLYQQNEQVTVARSGYLPQVDAGLSSQFRTSTDQTEEAFNVTASQLLYDFGKVENDVNAELFGVERDQARVLLAIDQLALQVAKAVIDIQRFETLLTIAEDQVDGVTEIQALAERRSQLGASTRSDEVQAQSRVEAARAALEQYGSQLSISRNNLKRLVGAQGPVSVADTLPDDLLQVCSSVSEQFSNVPEIMVADAQREEARAQIARREADFYPTVSAEAGFNQFINQTGNGDDSDVSLGLNISSSLYKGGATRAQKRSADYVLQALEASKDNVMIELQKRLQDAREQARSAKSQIAILSKRVAGMELTQELYRQQYLSLGTRSLLDLLNAEEEAQQAKIGMENARYDMYAAQLDCLYASSGFRGMFNISDEAVQGVSLSP
ncbi:TolC family outer membrane protein [Halomonas sp. THAF12]|uniref:TolC family outer membrane protein n=1 Tax=Halomonas sp. B23F22_10 TaxID=3459515 RepID=UPI00373F11C0